MSNIPPFNLTQKAQKDIAQKIEEAHKASNALPVCPYCNTEAMYSFRQMEAGPWSAVQIFCGNVECRKLFNVQITGPSAQAVKQAAQAAREPRIVIPH